jgi:iron complex outermembrane recepter protein
MTKHLRVLLSSTALLGLCCAAPAVAQVAGATPDTPPDQVDVAASARTGAQPGTDESGGREIVVTAERRGVAVQKLPASVIALSGEALKDRNVRDVTNLQTQVPSLSFVTTGFTPFINIRGVGLSESAPNQTDGVAVHLDGAYIAREFTLSDAFFDLDHVEVLRGPQGTYVGQNSSGGAIFINTRAPTLGGSGGFAEATLATFGRVEVGAGVDIPIGDDVAIRASGNFERRNSFYDNKGVPGRLSRDRGDNQPGNLQRGLARLQALWRPVDALKLRVLYQYSDTRTDGVPFRNFTGLAGADGRRDLAYDYDTANNTRYHRVTGIVDWDVGDAFTVHAVSSYQRTHVFLSDDTDHTNGVTDPAFQQSATYNDLRDRYYTNEINLVSKGEGPFQWTVGATMLDYAQRFSLQPGSTYGPTDPGPDFSKTLFIAFDLYRRNQAVFGEVAYKLLPTLEFRAGVRYNWDQVGIRGDSVIAPLGPNGPLQIPAGPNEPSYHAATGRILVNWTPADDQLVYGTISRGYKPGGWTPVPGGIVTPTSRYGKEQVTNYEVGVKSALFDRAVRASLSAFYMDYKGYQATVATDPANPTSAVTRNVQGTKIKGVEAQVSVNVAHVVADANVSVLSAKYGDLAIFEQPNALGLGNPAVPTLINLDGRTINYAPRFSGNASAGYVFDLANATLTPRLQVYHVSGQWTNFFHAPFQRIPGYTTVDLHVTYAARADWKLDVYATNLLDNDYVAAVGGSSYPYIGSYSLGAPREVGARLSYSF